ncbi:MAG: PDZ domain-containing protein [Planctomycetota bacterium]
MPTPPATRAILPLLWLFALLALPSYAAAQDDPTRQPVKAGVSCDWTVSLKEVEQRVWTNRLELRGLKVLRATGRVPKGTLTLCMPVWSPGAYQLANYSKNVSDMAATTAGDDPKPLALKQSAASSWEIQVADDIDAIVVTFKTGGRGARSGGAAATRADFLGTSMFLYVDGSTDIPATVRFTDLPDKWNLHCPLPTVQPARGARPAVFAATDFDQLCDTPCAFGPFEARSFVVGKTTIDIVVSSDDDMIENCHKVLREPVEKIVKAASDLMGGLPFDRYVFFYYVQRGGRGGGGLEHLNSTQIWMSGPMFTQRTDGLFSVTAHELFHAWNVKRIRTAAINPYDYSKLPDLDCLWFHEGVTSYYADIIMARAGLMSSEAFYKRMAGLTQRMNATRDYYHYGEVYGFLLDVLIRQRTNNAKSLDDVMRYMWNQFGKHTPPKPFDQTAGIRDAVKAATGVNLDYVFDRWIVPRNDMPFAEILRQAGMVVKVGAGAESAWSGIAGDFDVPSRSIKVTDVVPGSGAAEAGLQVGDRITKIDGEDATARWAAKLHDGEPGSMVDLMVQRENVGEMKLTFALGRDTGRSAFTFTPPAADDASPAATIWRGLGNFSSPPAPDPKLRIEDF